jgi:archaemetzincin
MKTVLLFLILIGSSLNTSTVKLTHNKTTTKVVYLRPLGNVNPDYLNVVKTSVEKFYGFKCVVKNKINFTNDLLTNSKTRYDAAKILSKFKTKDYLLILTEKDIACKHNNISEWGVFGLGTSPGTTCVVSTFRFKQNVTKEKFYDRLTKISLHEIGHNLGLPHCKSGDNRCIMNDAGGTIKEVDGEQKFLCKICKNKYQ